MLRAPWTVPGLLCLLLLADCGYPPKFLDRRQGLGGTPITKDLPPVDQVPVKGFEIRVTYRGRAGQEVSVDGELLAVDQTSLWVLTANNRLRVPRASIVYVKLELHPSGVFGFGVWTGVGTASIVSHGWFALLSGPLWLAAGIPSTVGATLNNDLKVPLDRLDQLAQFARYPAGMPGGRRPLPASAPASQPASRPAPPASQPATRPARLPPYGPPLPRHRDGAGMVPPI